jgi:hypothetical protein
VGQLLVARGYPVGVESFHEHQPPVTVRSVMLYKIHMVEVEEVMSYTVEINCISVILVTRGTNGGGVVLLLNLFTCTLTVQQDLLIRNTINHLLLHLIRVLLHH